MLKRALFSAFATLLSSYCIQAYAACEISDFKDINYGNFSRMQKLSYLYKLTNKDWDTVKRNIGGDFIVDEIPIGVSYDDMHASVKSKLEIVDKNYVDDLATSWFTSSLSQNDLEAYKTCHENESLSVFVKSFDDDSGKVILNWVAPPGAKLKEPFNVSSVANVLNVREINSLVKRIPIDTTIKNFEFLVVKSNHNQHTILSIGSGAFSRVAYIPPPPVNPITPTTSKVSFDANSANVNCDSGGNFDDRFCTILDQFIIPEHSGEVLVSSDLKLDINDDGKSSDPHRQTNIQIQCGNNYLKEYLGTLNSVKQFVMPYAQNVKCNGVAGSPLHVKLDANPRGGSSVVVTGKVAVSIP